LPKSIVSLYPDGAEMLVVTIGYEAPTDQINRRNNINDKIEKSIA